MTFIASLLVPKRSSVAPIANPLEPPNLSYFYLDPAYDQQLMENEELRDRAKAKYFDINSLTDTHADALKQPFHMFPRKFAGTISLLLTLDHDLLSGIDSIAAMKKLSGPKKTMPKSSKYIVRDSPSVAGNNFLASLSK